VNHGRTYFVFRFRQAANRPDFVTDMSNPNVHAADIPGTPGKQTSYEGKSVRARAPSCQVAGKERRNGNVEGQTLPGNPPASQSVLVFVNAVVELLPPSATVRAIRA
jgi:hypothetical protein